MALRLPELSSLPSIDDPKFNDRLRAYMREFGLTIENALDKVEDNINSEVNLVTESFVSVDSNYSAGQRSVMLVDTSSGNVTITLPDPADAMRGIYVIKKITTGGETLTVEASNGADIEGASSYSTAATNYPAIRVFSDGTAYWII